MCETMTWYWPMSGAVVDRPRRTCASKRLVANWLRATASTVSWITLGSSNQSVRVAPNTARRDSPRPCSKAELA